MLRFSLFVLQISISYAVSLYGSPVLIMVFTDFQKITVCPLFAALPPALQMKVFEKTKPGHRKIILATNIAETSITIPGVKYVIDTGMVKVKGILLL